MSANGLAIGGFGDRGDDLGMSPQLDRVAELGTLETRAVPGVVTGRSVDQLFLRRSDACFIPLTCGPNPVRLLSADIAAGVASVQRK